jgi:hypothetical protein
MQAGRWSVFSVETAGLSQNETEPDGSVFLPHKTRLVTTREKMLESVLIRERILKAAIDYPAQFI